MMPTAKQDRPTNLAEMAEQIQSRRDFVDFARALLTDLKERPDEWENQDLAAYLEAVGAWTEDMDGYYQGKGITVPPRPSWKMFGQMLLAAKVYE